MSDSAKGTYYIQIWAGVKSIAVLLAFQHVLVILASCYRLRINKFTFMFTTLKLLMFPVLLKW